jgi:hypothetical protein
MEMTVSIILEHLLVSLGAWAVGVIVGGGLGILIALKVRTLFIAAPHLRRFSMFIPWRTVVLNLLIIPWTPASIPLVGFGSASVWLNTSLAMFLFAMPFTTSLLLERWYPSPFAIRLMAGLRTLATASLVAAALAGLNGGYGIGWYMLQSLFALDYGSLLRECLILASVVLILDVLLGIVQLIVANRVGNGQ